MAKVNDPRTYAELCKAAVELEREGKWSAAADLYDLASKRAKHPPARSAAITKREAALKNLAAEDEVASPDAAGAVEAAMPTVRAGVSDGDPILPAVTADDVVEAQTVIDTIDKTEPKTTTKEKTMTTTATEKKSDREAMLAKKERVRMKQNKVEIGMELQHIRRGKTLARCTYAAERCFIFDGKQYSSLSDAGSAAAKKMGMKNPSVNGWIFWGVEKREA